MILPQHNVFLPRQNMALDKLEIMKIHYSTAAVRHNESTKLKTLELTKIRSDESTFWHDEQGLEAWRSSAKVLSV